MTTIEELRGALDAKAADLDGHAAATGSSFFEAVYRAQSAILREFAADIAAAVEATVGVADRRSEVPTRGRRSVQRPVASADPTR